MKHRGSDRSAGLPDKRFRHGCVLYFQNPNFVPISSVHVLFVCLIKREWKGHEHRSSTKIFTVYTPWLAGLHFANHCADFFVKDKFQSPPQAQHSSVQSNSTNKQKTDGTKKLFQHITLTLIHLHWIKSCINYKLLLLTYKSLHALSPLYLTNLLHPYAPLRRLRSSNSGLLSIHNTKLWTFADRAFCVAAPALWNHEFNKAFDLRQHSTLLLVLFISILLCANCFFFYSLLFSRTYEVS